MYLGIKAVIAKSFARIHKSNLINFGILPLEFENPADYDAIKQGDFIEITNIIHSLRNNKKLTIGNITLKYELSTTDIEIIIAGGKLNYIKNMI